MGLRMFVEPDVTVAKARLPKKSILRRQPSVRRRRPARFLWCETDDDHDSSSRILSQRARNDRGLPDRAALIREFLLERSAADVSNATIERDTSDQESSADLDASDFHFDHQSEGTSRRDTSFALLNRSIAQPTRRPVGAVEMLRQGSTHRELPQTSVMAQSALNPIVGESEGSESRRLDGSTHVRAFPAADRAASSSGAIRAMTIAPPLTPGFPPAYRTQSMSRRTRGRFAARWTELNFLAVQIYDIRAAQRYRRNITLRALTNDVNAMIDRRISDLTPEYLAIETQYIQSIREQLRVMMSDGDDAESLRLLRTTSDERLRSRARSGSHWLTEVSESGLPATHAISDERNSDGLGDRQRSFSPDDEIDFPRLPQRPIIPRIQWSDMPSGNQVSNSSLAWPGQDDNSGDTPMSGEPHQPCPAIDMPTLSGVSRAAHSQQQLDQLSLESSLQLSRLEALSRRLERHRSREARASL